jgi:hypothetical protein
MNKKILALALISAALFFACTADGLIDDPPPKGSGGGGGGTGSCTIPVVGCIDGYTQEACDAAFGSFNPGGTCGGGPNTGNLGSCTDPGYTCEENMEQTDCYSYETFAVNGTCNTSTYPNCVIYGDCYSLSVVGSKSTCFAAGGYLASNSYCN